jgi:hypothetical protein
MVRLHCVVLALLTSCAAACSRGAGAAAPGGVSAHVVCVSADDGRTSACDSTALAREFDRWLTEAVYEPGSTFTVWVNGLDRQSGHVRFVACVPRMWGAHVMEAKAAFVRTARERVAALAAGTTPDSVFPEGCAAPSNAALGRHTVQILSANHDAVSSDTVTGIAEQRHTAVVCDRSDSGLGITCNLPDLIQAYDAWFGSSGGGTGSTFTVYKVGTSRDTVQRIFSVTLPNGSPGGQAAYLIGARRELAGVLTDPLEKGASAVAETVHLAASELQRQIGAHRLVVLSDLRQFTPHTWNFERKVPSSREFVAWLDEHGLKANLKEVPVVVCGLHNQRAPGARPFDATLANRVQEAWEGAFHAMGAAQIQMFAACEGVNL